MKCWIICRPCDDPYYEGHPHGAVFTDEAKAKAFIAEINGTPEDTQFWRDTALYLEEGEIK